MHKLSLAINGFGRIGRTFLRALIKRISEDIAHAENIDLVAINTGPDNPELAAHLFAHDSIYKNSSQIRSNYNPTDKTLEIFCENIKIWNINIISEPNPEKIAWYRYSENLYVIESSGRFRKREQAQKHIQSGAHTVIITAPSPDSDREIIMGINHDQLTKQDKIISLGSCTTNCLAPLVKILDQNFGLAHGFMTTVHAYTNDQVILDQDHTDWRRARAGAQNIIPTKTGATQAITRLYPHLAGKIQAYALRVPVPAVSLVDFSFELANKTPGEKILEAFTQASKSSLKNILGISEKPLVSSDYISSPYSSCIDKELFQWESGVKNRGKRGRIVSWYDNEWGYCERIIDFLLHNKEKFF